MALNPAIFGKGTGANMAPAGGGAIPNPPGAIPGWRIDPAGYNDPRYMNDIQNTAPRAGADWTGYQQNSLNSGMGDYAYWLTQQGGNGGGGGANGSVPIQGYGGIDWAQNDNQAAVARANQGRWDEYLKAAQPWRMAAGNYLDLLNKTYSGERNVMDIPGVKAQYELGRQAAERQQAAGRYTYSGRSMKELERYGQDYASTAYGTEIGRLNTLARMDAPFNPPPQMNAANDVMTLADFNKKYAGFGFGGSGSGGSAGGGGGGGGYSPVQDNTTGAIDPKTGQVLQRDPAGWGNGGWKGNATVNTAPIPGYRGPSTPIRPKPFTIR